MKGDTSQYYPNPVYGKKGVPSLNNTPGSTFYDYTRWKDSKGDFWYLYSRWPGYLKVLWRYEVAINSWTWMWGDTTFTDIYNYGGVPCHPHVKAINPLPRDLASACWTDACDNLWVMGGRAATKSSNPVLNDLLFYSTKNNRWSWVAGDFISKDSSSYGTLNVPSVFNYPSSRIWAHPFKDSLRNMCFFGGLGADGYHSFADIWSFTPDTNCTYCKIINTPPPPPPPPPTPTITTSDNTMLSDSDSRIPLIYPNPCDGKAALINIVLFSEINVYDQAGVLIFSRKNNSNTADIEIEEPGVYFIELVSGQKRQYLKLVVLTNK